MKRFFVILLAFAMCLGIAACGVTDNGGNVDITDAPTEAPTAEPTADPTAEPTAEPTSEPTTAPSANAALGEIVDGVYINETLGLKFAIPSDWVIADGDDESTCLNASNTMGTNVLIMCSKIAENDELVGLSAEQIAQQMAQTIQDNGSTAGLNYSIGDIVTIDFCDEEYVFVPASCDYAGISMEQAIYLRIVDGNLYSIIITWTSLDSTTIAEIAEYFSAV